MLINIGCRALILNKKEPRLANLGSFFLSLQVILNSYLSSNNLTSTIFGVAYSLFAENLISNISFVISL